MTLDLYVYVVISDEGFLLSSQFLAGTFSRFLCTVLLLFVRSLSQVIPSSHKKSLDDFAMAYACSMDIN